MIMKPWGVKEMLEGCNGACDVTKQRSMRTRHNCLNGVGGSQLVTLLMIRNFVALAQLMALSRAHGDSSTAWVYSSACNRVGE